MEEKKLEWLRERWHLESEVLEATVKGQESRALRCAEALWQHDEKRKSRSLRTRQNSCIALNALLRRALGQSGGPLVRVRECYERNKEQVEVLTTDEGCRFFWRRMVMRYCRLARQEKHPHLSPTVRRAVELIAGDLKTDLTLNALSGKLSVNASYLSTLFRKEMGQPLTEYVNQQRIKQAVRLLKETELPIKEVASCCGIPDVCYFSRLCKRYSGRTPGQVRKKSQEEQGEG